MKYVLGIDFGGGASKATLLSEEGRIVATHTVEYPTVYPAPRFVGQNPMDWFSATKENILNVLQKSGVRAEDIKALFLDAATHTAVMMDENFHVLRPAIYWTDTRCIEEVTYLQEQYGDIIEKEALHAPSTIWTLPQLLWVKRHEPEVFAKAKKILFAKDFVRHLLTGDYVTDHIEAQGSMLYDTQTGNWSKTLCGILEFAPADMPTLVNPTDVAGTVTAEAAKETGLAEGTPVLCGSTDTVMEIFASGALAEGDMTIKLATAGRICVLTDKPFCDKNLINYSYVLGGLWYPGTATKSCASSYRWYRDTFGGEYKTLDGDAALVPLGAEGLMYHPYLNGELTPYQDPLLCASFVGMRAGHTKAHFTRALLEGVSLSMLDCLQTLDGKGIAHKDSAVIIGGGGKSPFWRQITADVLGFTLIEKKYSDSSFGSAMMAGVWAGFFKNPAEAAVRCNEVVSVTAPNAENHEKYQKIFKKYKKVQNALESVYHDE